MVGPRYQDISMGMGPSIFREKIAMIAGTAAKGPMISDMTKELTNQKVSASLPVVSARIGAATFFPLRNVFFMADLLSRMSWAAQNHFMPRLLWDIRKAHAKNRREKESEKFQGSSFRIKTDRCKP
jgi:hypothetical protein